MDFFRIAGDDPTGTFRNNDPGGPEGIRTPDLLSAIEARSQLRYRPGSRANGILPEGGVTVKKLYK